MTTVSRFSRQNDVGFRALNVALWENLVPVVVLVVEFKALYLSGKGRDIELNLFELPKIDVLF